MAEGTIFPAFLKLEYQDDGSAKTRFLQAVDDITVPAEQRFADLSQACVLLQDVDYSVLYRSDAIVRAKVIGYQARPEQKDALFRLEIEQVLSGKPLAAPVIEARWERRYKPAPQIWDGYNNVIVGLKLTNGAPALIVRESCGG